MLASVAWTLGAACVGMLVWRGRTRILTAVLRWGFAALVVLSPLGWACVSTNLGRAPGGAEALRAPERPDKPNIILLVVDTLRADYCPARGGSCSTPALESLAQKGVLFEQCYALAPWTPPSMSGMFASAYPPGLAAGPTRKPWRDEARSYSLRPQDKSLAELLVSDGRKTCALVGNPVVSEMTSLFHGFETRADSPATVKRPSGYLRCLPLLASTLSAHIPSLKITSYNDTTIDLTRWAVAYLRSRKNAPFFLWVHYLDPHAPYDPPAAYRTMNGPWPSFAANLDDEKWFEDGDHGLPLGDFDARNRPYVRSLYEGEVRYVDDSIGRIAAELRRLGLEDNTFVCVTSDHGEEFWEHGGWGHGQTLYDELIHVPLILAGPGLSHRTVEERVSAIDLMPTLAELAGVAPAESWLGASLAPLARGEVTAPSPKPCYARATSYRVRAEPLEMVISGQYKLVRGVNTGSDEFYNIPQDPGETRNLAAEEPQRVSQLAELLDRWRAVNPPDFKTFFGGSPIESNREEALQQLRAVGYL
jgi:arylsulfatase